MSESAAAAFWLIFHFPNFTNNYVVSFSFCFIPLYLTAQLLESFVYEEILIKFGAIVTLNTSNYDHKFRKNFFGITDTLKLRMGDFWHVRLSG